jgi:hypothetical protein
MARGRPRKTDGADNATTKKQENGANLGFEAQMFLAADKPFGISPPGWWWTTSASRKI